MTSIINFLARLFGMAYKPDYIDSRVDEALAFLDTVKHELDEARNAYHVVMREAGEAIAKINSTRNRLPL